MDPQRYAFSLEVLQQPQRARMCGFGDKDRRPITPPPCVKLNIFDRHTGQAVDINTLDISFFVLTVDLWDETAQTELNLVVHPSTSTQTLAGSMQMPSSSHSRSPQGSHYNAMPYNAENSALNFMDNNANGYTNSQASYRSSSTSTLPPITDFPGHVQNNDPNQAYDNSSLPHTPGSFTRNLIGSLVASAFKLHDTEDNLGVWFVLQDLSVRTEGTFRLKFNFINLSTGGQCLLTSGSTPVLCSAFSSPFAVFSAKRFPGMIESTDISRTFANQGIKIPIRKADA